VKESSIFEIKSISIIDMKKLSVRSEAPKYWARRS
jgi:hypothetical protein